MKQKLEYIAQDIERELLSKNQLTINESIYVLFNSKGKSPLHGSCYLAVGKFLELTPELKLNLAVLTFKILQNGKGLCNHVVAYVTTPQENLIVDPTLRQYIPKSNSLVFEKSEYPLDIAKLVVHNAEQYFQRFSR